MSDTATEETEAVVETDEVREALVAAFADELGDAFKESHIIPGVDLWIRIDRSAWRQAAEFAESRLGFRFFDFLSAIDWMPSPYGRDMDSEQDWRVHGREAKELDPMEQGYAGGETRFQMLCRYYSVAEHIGINIKADLPDDDPSVDTIIPVFPGANWHEREAWEMFGIHINEHPDLRALYLPSGFEGNPLRKDYPLVARRVKPWPGIVDVEGMPEDPAADSGEGDA